MKPIYRLFCAVTFFFATQPSQAQIVLNEICPSNISIISNDDGKYDDWIEIYNSGSSTVNLQGYGLSDDPSDLHRFTFPSVSLNAGSRMVVFCSDRDQTDIVNHWETPVSGTGTWKYFVGTANPDTNWRNNSFSDNTWQTGSGGIGFGDGDDNTIITTCNAVMMRKHFAVSDTANIIKAIFHIDYDDGFVAYLNGVEIARANIGVVGDRPINTVNAYNSHEAVMYQGMHPDSFYLDPAVFKNILRIGDNVLAVQVHNTSAINPDLTSIPYLSFGIRNTVHTWANPPSWFGVNQPEHYQANFKLSRNGETVYLTGPTSTVIDQRTFTNIEMDNSIGRLPDGSVIWCTFSLPTPNAANNSSVCYAGYCSIPLYSKQAGFYTGSQWLTITTTQPSGVIRFTTDGKDVTASSPIYGAPILLSSTQTLKACVFAPGFLPSPTVVNSYFINENIHYPVFTITTDPENLFNYYTGIYVYGPNADSVNSPYFGSNFWEDWEKPASIEFYDKSKNRVTKFNADISIYGNYSRGKPQKSFEIKMSDKYGTDELHYSFFSEKPFVDHVDNIILRNAGTDNNMLHFRDHLMEQNLEGTYCDHPAQEEAVMFLNGQFWGIYQIAENEDNHYMKTNYDLKKDEIDLLKEGGTIEVKAGSDTGFYNMFNYAASMPPNDPAFYSGMNSRLDLQNYADYFISETYYCNEDWLGDWTNNVKFWRETDGGKWRYMNYDLDFGLFLQSHADDNILGRAINPNSSCYTSDLFDMMLSNDQFRRYFINRYADLMNTIFLPSHLLPQLQSIHDSMALDINRQYTRWGLTSLVWNTEYNKASSFINARLGYARYYVDSQFALNGQVTLYLDAVPAGAGRIKISTITPTTLPWNGVYFDGNPVTITAIPNPGYTFDYWTSNAVINGHDQSQTTTYNFFTNDQIVAHFTGGPATTQITFSEINYHSDSLFHSDDWIEFHNYGSTDIDISGWKFKDDQDNHIFEFPTNTVIAAGGYLVLAEDIADFSNAYPSVTNVMGPLGFSFANGDEQLRLFDYKDSLYLSVYYSDQMPWPEAADGEGYTLELLNPFSDLNDGNSWFAGCLHGSPGKAYSTISASINSTGNLSFCSPGSVSLNSNTGSGYSYQWRLNGSPISGETSSAYNAQSAGWFSVLVDSSGCMASDSVMVNAITVTDPMTASGYNCGGGSVSLSASGGGTLNWYDAPNGSHVGSGTNFNTQYLSSASTFYVQADSGGCESAFIPVEAFIYDHTVDPVSSDVSRCGYGTVTLTATDTATINWYNASTGGILLQTGSSFTTPVINNTTTYYVEAGTACPSARIAVNAIVNNVAAPVTTDGSRCGTGTVDLTATSIDTVDWYDQASGGNNFGTTHNFTTPVISVTTTFYAEAKNGCSSVRVPAIATVTPASANPVVTSSSNCGTGDVTLSASAADPISWYDAPTGGNLLGTGSTLTLTGISSTTIVYAQAGTTCPGTSIADTAYIYSIPTVNLGNDVIISSPQIVVLDAGAGFATYAWSTGESTQTITVNTTNTYTVTVTDMNGCTASDDIMVTVYTGISQQTVSHYLNIYPNPVHDLLTIGMPSSMTNEQRLLKLCDVTGRIVMSETTSQSGLYEIHVSALAKGVYLLSVETQSEKRIVQVVVN
jgi:hypothetical protein